MEGCGVEEGEEVDEEEACVGGDLMSDSQIGSELGCVCDEAGCSEYGGWVYLRGR